MSQVTANNVSRVRLLIAVDDMARLRLSVAALAAVSEVPYRIVYRACRGGIDVDPETYGKVTAVLAAAIRATKGAE